MAFQFRYFELMNGARIIFTIILTVLFSCSSPTDPSKVIPPFLIVFPAQSFAYPVGEKDYATERNDWWDYWYNAQDFGENRHLGEDWNKTSGGDTDCGEPVFAAAGGEIIFAKHGGPGWGHVIMIEHTASDGTKVRSLYGHLLEITKVSGSVTRREQIGTIGGADGRYPCHLHFEIRWNASPLWDEVGPGYSENRHGWIDPSEFIDRTR